MIASDEDVVIVGGGIAGLACAIALRQAGRAPLVLERAAEPESAGAGIALGPNAVRALDALGAGRAVRAAGQVVARSEIRTAAGRTLTSVATSALAARCGAPLLVVDRRSLHAALRDRLEDVPVRPGVEVTTVDRDATVHVAAGGQVRARLVVGADGLRSRVRAAVAPEARVRDSGLVAWRAITAADELPGAVEAWCDGALAGCAPVAAGRVYWWAAARSGRLARAAFADWAPPLGRLIAETPPSAVLEHRLESVVGVARWSSGPVTLAGDAAHAMLPNLGQGAAQGLEDAIALGDAARDVPDGPALLAGYERRRRRRAATVQRQSAQMARVAHLRGRAAAARDALLRHAPAAVSERRLVGLVGCGPPA